jgi:enoyl-CoA hydratase/carnithine racemase
LESNLVLYKKEGKIGKITLNRINKRNAFDDKLLFALIDAFNLSIKNEDLVVIFTANGKDFTVGADLDLEFSGINNANMEAQATHLMWNFQKLTSIMMSHPGIIIVGYKGWVIGGGFEISLTSDFRIAAENARFWMSEIGLGLFQSNGSTKRLAQLVGEGFAKEMIILGKKIPAQQALKHHLVSEICKTEDLDTKLNEMAVLISEKPPLSLKLAKKMINESSSISIEETLYKETMAMVETFKSLEAKKQVEAFIKKREN